MSKVNFEKMSELIKDPFMPLDVFRIEDTAVRLVKIRGRYHWHKHTDQDELFIVIKGQMMLNFKDHRVTLDEGEGYLVKKGVLHQSASENEATVMMVEPYETKAIGD